MDFEKRVDSWMTEIAGKIREMDIACEKSIIAMPQFTEYGPGMSVSEDWENLQKEVYERKQEFWAEFHGGWDEDFDYAHLLEVLRLKLKWMVFYWDNFGHCANGWHASRQMKLAIRLIDIILNMHWQVFIGIEIEAKASAGRRFG